MTIRWNGGAGEADPPPFLMLDVRTTEIWEGAFTGEVRGLVDWLAGRPVRDLAIGRPDLETLFRRYYGGGTP